MMQQKTTMMPYRSLLFLIYFLLTRTAAFFTVPSLRPTMSNTDHQVFSSFAGLPSNRQDATKVFIGTGFSFDDGEQVLVSVQKPLGILLEQDDEEAPVMVAEVDPSGSAGRAGVQAGDILVAVQNASVETQSLEYVMEFLGQAPRVVNLRFIRR